MDPLRILHVFGSLDRGGAESMVMSLYRAIDKNKIQFDFAVNKCDHKYAFEEEIDDLGGRIFFLPRFGLLNFFTYCKAWITLLSNHPELKIIHAHHTTPAFVYLFIANLYKRQIIAHSHTAGGNNSIKSFSKKVARYSLRFFDMHRLACSNAAAKWMFGKKSENSKVLNNSIDTRKFAFNESVREQYQKDFNIENKFVIGHVGRFDKDKNQEFLIEIFNQVYSLKDNSVLMLVGDGVLKPEIEKKVIDLSLRSSVIFTGVRSDIPDLLQAFDCFVFPSIFEGLPVTVIEAQSSGLKCFVSDSVTEEVKITDLVEFISLSKSPESWAERIITIANGYERTDMSKEIIAAKYDVHSNARWLEDFYMNLAN